MAEVGVRMPWSSLQRPASDLVWRTLDMARGSTVTVASAQ